MSEAKTEAVPEDSLEPEQLDSIAGGGHGPALESAGSHLTTEM